MSIAGLMPSKLGTSKGLLFSDLLRHIASARWARGMVFKPAFYAGRMEAMEAGKRKQVLAFGELV